MASECKCSTCGGDTHALGPGNYVENPNVRGEYKREFSFQCKAYGHLTIVKPRFN